MKKFIVIFTLLFNLVVTNIAYNSISVIVDDNERKNLTTDDIIELKITLDHNNKDNQISKFDSSPLSKDFDVISKSKQVYHSIINGKTSSKIQWVISLRPKKPGNITIPALTLGNETTKPFNLNINKAQYNNTKSEVFLKVQANKQIAYANSAVSIQVQVHVDSTITTRDLTLSEPKSEDFSLVKINDTSKQVFLNNKRYKVFNVNYLAFFKKTGMNTLPPFGLSGLKLKVNSRSNDIFSLYPHQWLPLHKSSNDLSFKIEASPADNGSPLILANKLDIKQEWSSQTSKIELGDAIQRTVIVTGENITAALLPVFMSPSTDSKQDNYKVYIDKPEKTETIDNNTLISTLSQKITYIPTKEGPFTIPEKTFSWWNININNKVETTVEGKYYTVTASSGTKALNNTTNKNINKSIENTAKTSTEITTADTLLQTSSDSTMPVKDYKAPSKIVSLLLVIIIFMTSVIIYLIIQLRKKIKVKHTPEKRLSKPNTPKLIKSNIYKHQKAFKKLIRSEQYEKAYAELIKIARLIYPQSKIAINEYKQSMSPNAALQLNKILSSLYGNDSSIDKTTLSVSEILNDIDKQYAQWVENYNDRLVSKKNSSQLPELYPE